MFKVYDDAAAWVADAEAVGAYFKLTVDGVSHVALIGPDELLIGVWSPAGEKAGWLNLPELSA